MTIAVHLAILSACVFLLARFLPGIRIRSAWSAVVVAVTFSVLNFFLGWLLRGMLQAVLFVPAILSLGALYFFVPFIVNAILLWATDKLLASFEIQSLRGLVIASAVITVVNGIFYASLFQNVLSGHLHAAYGGTHWV